ncbi:winged helix-turn-helix transcriptional regulator [Paenibacillus cymbidii]|uniref:winged helix-turn-helix transcriptional regulator n=1 Tax=Paenibacillus cymbidii TaxID=1639034 RepID=UPI001081B870|nr:helix-turn-helix domain-containing protein [Paenibacillus cymbidii]
MGETLGNAQQGNAEPIALARSVPGDACPIERALGIIGSKWTFLIVRDLLLDGTLRFGDLLRSLEGISPKTLSLRLRELEEAGIVTRTVYPEIPPRVEYALTDKGRQLERIFIELKRYGLTLDGAEGKRTANGE